MTDGATDAWVSADDKALLARAAAWDQHPQLSNCAPVELSAVAQKHGLEFATAVLYDRLLSHPTHRAFFERIQSQPQASTPPALVGIIPGAFYREHKNTGADGTRLAAMVEAMNCRVERVPLESFGSLKQNAARIVEWLSTHNNAPLTLVSLSKGSADLKVALASANAAKLFEHVRVWISLSGLTEGTPLVAWLRRQRFRRWGVWFLLWMRGQKYSTIEELDAGEGRPLAVWPPIPAHLRIIHVVAFPLRRHLAHPWAARAYERLAPLGPNDGGGFLLGDVVHLPGTVFPVWGADHYLQPALDVTPLLRRVLAEAMSPCDELRQTIQSAAAPSKPPANKSTA